MDLILLESVRMTDNTDCDCVKLIIEGKYKDVINSELCQELLRSSGNLVTFEETIQLSISKKLENCKNDNKDHYDILSIGIASLQLFVQINWTGPPDDCNSYEPPLNCLRKQLSGGEDVSESEWADALSNSLVIDGEAISPNIHNLELLLLARAVLNSSELESILSTQWWRLRCLLVHQQILEERSPTLYDQLTGLLQQLMGSETIQASSALLAQLQLETARLWLYYSHVAKADVAIKAALKLLGLEVNLVGALGKRTKYQEKEIAQLTLSVNVNREISESSVTHLTTQLPKDVRLEDDVRLDKIAFTDSKVGEQPELRAIEQAAILATCMYKQKSQPKDKLHTEEITPYLICLTTQPQVWTLQTSALLQRSKIDSEHQRTVERSLTQFQSLLDSVAAVEPDSATRLAWVYCSYLPPAWKIESLLANVYISLGMIQTALDVYLKLQLWEEVIACYNLLQLRHKAAEVIRQEMEKKETVKLWCLLGDATDDIECYRKAWELSREKSGRAQRHWAMYYFTRKQYAESIPHLEKSLNLNSLQESLWFRLGFAALTEEKWELAATAYRRYCTLEPESFEAWNNLAKSYVKLGQKARAFRALQEAVKCNYENWRVWDNLMAVSTDCGQFDEVIRCYHRVLDLNEKHVDEDVLKIMTKAIVNSLVDLKDCPTPKLRKQALALFGRLTSQVMSNSTVWQLYAQLAASDEATAESQVKVAQCLQKAYRAATQGNWERDVNTCQQVIDLCIDLGKAYVQCSSQCDSSKEKLQLLSSGKLPLKSVLSKVEKEQTDLITGELPEILESRHKDLLAQYEQLVDEIQRLQTG